MNIIAYLAVKWVAILQVNLMLMGIHYLRFFSKLLS